MKRTIFKSALLGGVIALGTLAGCDKKDSPEETIDPIEESKREFITLTAAIPDANGTAGNGGTMAYAVTHEQAIDPNFSVDIYNNGFHLRSARTARVQASEDGTELYNIQYTGEDGGTFNKYLVKGTNNYQDTGNELDLSDILGTSPRWNKAAEGIGIGVHLTGIANVVEGEAPNHVFKARRGQVRVAIINLLNPEVPNSTNFDFPFPAELEAQGYSVGRIDVPVLNEAQNKIFIGCNVSKLDPTKLSYDASGNPTWPSDPNRDLGTVTLVIDYPSLQNPKLIYSEVSKINNHGYRTTTQYVGDDGHIYQATATGGPDILRISKSTNDYDNSYHFSLDQALGVQGTRIQAWRYIKDGVGVVLYGTQGVTGGQVAWIDLNAKTATKISVDSEEGLGFGQYQNIGVSGDYAYVPLTPSGESGRLYVLNWKTKEVIKGAVLTGSTGGSYLGSY